MSTTKLNLKVCLVKFDIYVFYKIPLTPHPSIKFIENNNLKFCLN